MYIGKSNMEYGYNMLSHSILYISIWLTGRWKDVRIDGFLEVLWKLGLPSYFSSLRSAFSSSLETRLYP
jgi:hypothetical protein